MVAVAVRTIFDHLSTLLAILRMAVMATIPATCGRSFGDDEKRLYNLEIRGDPSSTLSTP